MTDHEQQIEMLTEKLNVLENESRRILSALQWATKVRLILFTGLLLFAVVTVFLFFRLYEDIKTERIAKVQQLISDKPAEFSEPLTRQIMALAEEQGPHVVEVFRQQAQKDSEIYLKAFDAERELLITNLQRDVEDRLARSYVTLLDEQEALLVKEFPVLEDDVKMKVVRGNMEKIYEKIGNRYYVNFLREELEDMADQLDSFPPARSASTTTPLGEQILTEFLELVRMMLVHSENYNMPEKTDADADAKVKAASPRALPKIPESDEKKEEPKKEDDEDDDGDTATEDKSSNDSDDEDNG